MNIRIEKLWNNSKSSFNENLFKSLTFEKFCMAKSAYHLFKIVFCFLVIFLRLQYKITKHFKRNILFLAIYYNNIFNFIWHIFLIFYAYIFFRDIYMYIIYTYTYEEGFSFHFYSSSLVCVLSCSLLIFS